MDDPHYVPRRKSSTSSSTTTNNNNVEAMMQKLRSEVLNVSSDLAQQRDTTMMRKSLTIMENNLVKNNEVFETHLKEVNEKHKHHVENKAKHYEETISNLKWQLQDRDNLVDKLKQRLDDCRTARMEALEELAKTQKQYGHRIKELELCISEGKESSMKMEMEMDKMLLEVDKVKDLKDALEVSRAELETLKRKVEELEGELKNKDSQIGRLEAMKERLEGSIEALEKENSALRNKLEEYVEICKNKDDENDHDPVRKMLEDQLAKLQSDWDETKKQLLLEQIRAEKLDTELAEVRKENGLLKVDIRIETREKKDLESKVELLEQQNKTSSERLFVVEDANHVLASKISASLDEIDCLRSEMKSKEDELVALSAVREELVDQLTQLEQDRSALQNEVAILKVKAGEVESMGKMIAEKNELIEEKMNLLEQKDRKIQALQNNVAALKELSTVLDCQLKEFEESLDKRLSPLEDAEKLRELLENENRDLREQLKNCRIELNEAKSLKVFTEKRLAKSEHVWKSESQSKEAEMREMMEKLNVATTRNEELSEELNTLMTQTSDLEGEKFELRKLLETAKSDKDRMSKEMMTLVSTIVHMKEEVMALQDGVKESIGKAQNYKGLFESLQEKYSVLLQSKNTHEVMFTTRIEQQEKLIDYLQDQLNAAQEKKKKKGFLFTPKREKDVIVPGKSFTPRPRGGFVVPSSLEKKKVTVEECEELLATIKKNRPNKNKEETPSTPAAFELTPGGSGKSHNLHKFLETRCESTQKCVACKDPVYKGRPLSKCELCHETFHLACAATAPKTCGFAEEEKAVSSASSSRAEPPKTDAMEVDDVFKGWVLIRTEKMRSAKNLFLKIEGTSLNVYESENDKEPLESLSLNEFTTVYFRLPAASTQMACAMKVNFDSDDDNQSAYIYMFHQDKTQKRYWIRGIQKFSKKNLASSHGSASTLGSELNLSSEGEDHNKDNSATLIKVNETVLFEDEGNGKKLYVNCIYMLPYTNIYLLGCDDGLYSLKSPGDAPVKIEGPQVIYQIDTLAAAKTAVFIEGPGQVLSTVYLGLLKTCAEAAECSSPKFKSQIIPRTNGCYMFASRGTSLNDTIVAAAASDLLLLCAWSGEAGLKIIREIKVGESITALLMTPQTVLYGNHGVFEIDTKTFELEPFLDSTDEAVSYIQLLNDSHGSYPVAILDVTQSRGNSASSSEPEYLICFQDIGIFVDGFGIRTREGEVLWSQAPIAFEYRHPFLYIFHFTSIEIQKLDDKSYTREQTLSQVKQKSGDVKETVVSRMISPPTRFHTLNVKTAPTYVGKSKDGVVVFLSDTQVSKVSEITPAP